jgi:Leucine-rich repeat (LRR) protein
MSHFRFLFLSGALLLLLGCSQPLAVSINNQPVYDPEGRLPGGEVIDADLQGCINLALTQRNVSSSELGVLSCANAGIGDLSNIGQLLSLRFLDLANNNIRNITPLETLRSLGALNLANNRIDDIGPLFNLPSLASVNLAGNPDIPCSQIRQLREQLGDNLSAPESCRGR